LVLILDPGKKEKEREEELKKVEKIIEAGGGKIETKKEWGAKKLAYPIRRLQEGFFFQIDFAIEPAKFLEVERTLRVTKEVIRFLMVRKETPPSAPPNRRATEGKRGEVKSVRKVSK